MEATIQADYYFGGPVANADVNVVVQQKPFTGISGMSRGNIRGYYEDMGTDTPYGALVWRRRANLTNAVLKTDATGKATLTFGTPQNSGQ